MVDLALLMHKLNHSDLAYTKRYLGITEEELEGGQTVEFVDDCTTECRLKA
jgi:hypothetical protein